MFGHRPRQGPPPHAHDDPLITAYFHDLSRFSLFTPAEEAAAAHRIQQLEVEEWVALFAHPPMIPLLLRRLRTILDGRMPRGSRGLLRLARLYRNNDGRLPARERKILAALGWEIGWKLHDLDCDRRVLNDVLACVRSLPTIERADPDERRVARSGRFARYLALVAAAGRATVRATEHFVLANLRLVVAVARWYRNGRMPFVDLIQEGNIGLLKAVSRYDVRKGYRFSTYASWWIRHVINRGLSEKARLVRIPVHVEEQQRRVERAATALASCSGREPTDEEIAAEMGLESVELRRRPGLETVISLDQSVRDEEGQRRLDLLVDEQAIDPETQVDLEESRSELREMLDLLPAVEASVLRLRFGLDGDDEKTLREIGDGRGRSRERIRQIEAAAMRRVKARFQSLSPAPPRCR